MEPRKATEAAELEVLILAPTGQDARLLSGALGHEGVRSLVVKDAPSLCARMGQPAGAVLVAEEALLPEAISAIRECLRNQDPWSDIPVIAMTSGGQGSAPGSRIPGMFSPSGNVVLIERPFHRVTLVSAVIMALRARKKQYEVRDLIDAEKMATRAREEFISIASHELKTPLTSLKLQTQMGRRLNAMNLPPEQLVPKLAELLAANHGAVEKLVRLVEDMLDATRITAGTFKMRKSAFDLGALVREVVNSFKPALADAGVEASIVADEMLMGVWDPFRIEQVVGNLLSNAARYAPGLPVEVSVRRRGDRAVLTVRDKGKGIAPEDHEKIFSRFERAAGSADFRGLGLGLYISRKIVEAHEGTIRVESEPGQGAAFIIDLPLS